MGDKIGTNKRHLLIIIKDFFIVNNAAYYIIYTIIPKLKYSRPESQKKLPSHYHRPLVPHRVRSN